MNYSFSKRDAKNRATLTINGKKVGRVHFRATDAWLNPYDMDSLKSKLELEAMGMLVETDPNNHSYPVKITVGSSNEKEVASSLSKAFRNI